MLACDLCKHHNRTCEDGHCESLMKAENERSIHSPASFATTAAKRRKNLESPSISGS